MVRLRKASQGAQGSIIDWLIDEVTFAIRTMTLDRILAYGRGSETRRQRAIRQIKKQRKVIVLLAND